MRRLVDGAAPEVQAEFDAVWEAIESKMREFDRHFDERCDHLSKRVDALEAHPRSPIPVVTPLVQHAPSPDYQSGLDAEPCGCEESEALRAELGAAHVERDTALVRAEKAEHNPDAYREQVWRERFEALTARAERAESEAAALRAEVERLRDEKADEYERGRKDARDKVNRLAVEVETIGPQLAAANALLERAHRENIRWSGTGTTKLARDIDAHLSGQAPARTDHERAVLDRLGEWSTTFGATLSPRSGYSDSFGDGVRCCKGQVRDMLAELARQKAAK